MPAQSPEPHEKSDVHTEGGTYVDGTVNTGGGPFIGRDQNIYHVREEAAYNVHGLTNPYLGLRAFTYADRTLYAGREQTAQAAVTKLTAPGAACTLLFITGASGSGKSSFAQAALLPKLESHYQKYGKVVRPAVFRPSQQPIVMLHDALLQLHPALRSLDDLATVTPADQINVLIIDQFEEAFIQSEAAQRNQLFHLLTNLLPFEQSHTHIIATLRADYLNELFDHKALWAIAKQGVELRAMSADELRYAIQKPVQVQHPQKRFAPELLERLVNDASDDPALLPLLQVTLVELWKKGSLTLGAYANLTQAFRQHAENVYGYTDHANANPHQERPLTDRAAILSLFLDLVHVTPDEDDRRDVRQRRTRSALEKGSAQRRGLIEEVVNARLLAAATETRDNQTVEHVEIIHETLIRNWARLRQAIDEQRRQLQRRARFQLWLGLWLQHERSAEHLLLTNVQLAEARALDEQNDIELQDPTARDFYRRSLEHQEAEQRRQLQAAQAQAERERRNNTRLRGALAWIGLLLLAAIGLALVAFNLRNEADREKVAAQYQTQVAIARQLAAQASEKLADNDFLASALLAVQGGLQQSTVETWAALNKVMTHPGPLLIQIRHDSSVAGAMWSKDEQRILSWSGDGTVGVWDVANGQRIATFRHEPSIDGVTKAVWSKDEQRILSWSGDNTVVVWDVASGQRLTTLRHDSSVNGAVWSKDEQHILSWSWDNTIVVWDVASGQRLTTLRHESDISGVNGAVWSKDEQRILFWSADNTVVVWDVASGQRLATLRHESDVSSITGGVWSKDEQRILAWSGDNPVVVWDVASGQRLATLHHESYVNGAVWSKDEQHILSWSDDNSIGVWDVASGQRLATFRHESDISGVNGAVWSQDEQRVLSWSRDNTVGVWDVQSGQRLATLHHAGSTLGVIGAAWTKDEQSVLTWSDDNTVGVWDVQSGQRLATLRHADWVNGAVWSKDEQRILAWSRDNTVGVWDVQSGQRFAILGHADWVTEAVWSQDEQRVLAWSGDKAVVWDVASGQRLATLRPASSVNGTAWSKDEQRILARNDDNNVSVWDVVTGQRLATLRLQDRVTGVVWSQDEHRILAWSEDGTVVVWDVASGQRLATLRYESDVSGVNRAAWSKNEQYILSWSGDMTVAWDMASGQRLTTLRHDSSVNGAVWSKDEQRVLSWSRDNTIVVWDLASGRRLATLRHERSNSGVTGAVWSKDEQRILSWSADSTVGVWDVQSGQRLATLRHETWVIGAAWSKNEQRILSWSGDGTVNVWDVAREQQLATLRHEDRVIGAAWSKDEQRILSWSDDKTVGVWDVKSGQRLATLRHEKAVWGAMWSNDEQRILSWSEDHTARIWAVDTPQLLQQVCELIPRNFTEDEWRTYFGAEPYQRTCPASAHLLGAAKRAAVETGDVRRVEELFSQAVAVAKTEDKVTLTLDPHAEALRYTVPVLAARANAAALACKVDEAIVLYRQVSELDPKFFPGDPQTIVPALAQQNGCK